MSRPPLYSRSGPLRAATSSKAVRVSKRPDDAPEPTPPPSVTDHAGRQRQLFRIVLAAGAGAIAVLALVGLRDLTHPLLGEASPPGVPALASGDPAAPAPNPLASTTLAYAKIIPSVVRVDGYIPKRDPMAGAGEAFPKNNAAMENAPIGPDDKPVVVGTGVVINKAGTILTSLHLVAAARKLRVVFANGMQFDADVDSTEPNNDLAVLKSDGIPPDLQAATLGAGDLAPGDQVMAIGFPFGIGPSASAGIVSGLGREFQENDQAKLTDLIQFDAAANPGNTGGPLVDSAGDVVGIVAAIVNPSGTQTFAGVGFAVPIGSAAKPVVGGSPL